MTTEIIWREATLGVYQVGTLVVNGYKVPYLQALRIEGDPRFDGRVTIALDERFRIDVNDYDLNTWVWLLAHAMAVAAGYNCHGEGSAPNNRFATQVAVLDQMPGTEFGLRE